MEIKDLRDFYIDLNGDVKASGHRSNTAIFVTDTDKPNSEYNVANNINEIKEAIDKVNPNFSLDLNVYKQYSLKYDKEDVVVGVKVWVDNNDNVDGLTMVLTGYEITADGVTRDYYFTAPTDAVNNFITSNKLVYEVKQFDTHKAFLYSVKYDAKNNIVNFKTYYIVNEHLAYYTNNMIPHLKKVLTF